MSKSPNTMEDTAKSSDDCKIHYEVTGKGRIGLLFVHGWMGSGRWWDSQRDYFFEKYQIIQIDLAGHGKSEKIRREWSVHAYAQDIKSVANNLDVDKIVLVGHSMSGSNVIEAFPLVKKAKAIILVDTLKNLDQALMPIEQTKQIFSMYRQDFKNAIENILPQYLFVKSSPHQIVSQLKSEFLQNNVEHAIATLEPFYKTDIRDSAKKVTAPVRSINSDAMPTELSINRKYFSDYEVQIISGVGHYPMLENPDGFNKVLEATLDGLGL